MHVNDQRKMMCRSRGRQSNVVKNMTGKEKGQEGKGKKHNDEKRRKSEKKEGL